MMVPGKNFEQMLAIETMAKTSGIRSILHAFNVIEGFNLDGLKISVLSNPSSVESIALNVSDLAPKSTINYFAESNSHFFDELDVNNIRILSMNTVGQNIPDLGILVGDLQIPDDIIISFFKASGQILIVPNDNSRLEAWKVKLKESGVAFQEHKLNEKLDANRISNLQRQGIRTSAVILKN